MGFLVVAVIEGKVVAIRAPESFVILGIQLKLLNRSSKTAPIASQLLHFVTSFATIPMAKTPAANGSLVPSSQKQ